MPGIALQRRDRADRDDAAGAGPDHAAEHGLGEARHRPEVDLHRRLGLVLGHHGGKGVIGLAGVVHEAEEALLLDRVAEDVERALLGKIDRMRLDAAPRMGRGELVDERFGGVARRPIGEVDVVLGRDERPDDRGAEPAAAAGDEDPPRHFGSAPMTRQVFWPPKPKEFDSTMPTSASRASFGTTSSGIAGSGTR